MKKFLFFLTTFFVIAFSAVAVNSNDITMVSYEQSCFDFTGTLALKNNTSEEIRNVSFQIIYLDMSGNPLDYKEFSENISIAPGMTKKIDIPAYERGRNYHYYKTKDIYGHPAFKIKFNLKGYNYISIEKNDDSSYEFTNNDDSSSTKSSWNITDNILSIILGIVAILFIIGVFVGLYVLVAIMAKKRNRNVALWVLLSVIANPIIIIIILYFIGEDDKLIE